MTYRSSVLAALFAVFALAFSGCTDAKIGMMTSYGEQAMVTMYSGGRVVFRECSTGKVNTETQSDGYILKAQKSGLFIRVSGDVVVEHGHPDCVL